MNKIACRDIVEFIENEVSGASFLGNGEGYVASICSLQEISDNSICWIKNRKYLSPGVAEELRRAEDILVVSPFKIDGVDCIVTDYPKGVFFHILNHFFAEDFKHSVSPRSTVLTEKIGRNVHIGENCYIGADVSVGDNTVIHPNVSIICPCKIGHGCEIFPGAVIGADGFGYYFKDGVPYRERHFRGVLIGDYVDIGSNSCIDRGLITDTVIKDHVKIDNLCHIGHNAVIEENCLIIAGTVICGSALVKKGAYLAPGAVILNQITVEEKAKVGANSLAVSHVRAGSTVLGVPGKRISG